MLKHIKYLKYLLRHIWFVRKACWFYGIYWQGMIHDLSKFRLDEWRPYAEFFYGDRRGEMVDDHFDKAWLLHQKRNPHHWQYWVLPLDDGGTKVLPMPTRYRLEMLCDWWGASMALGYQGQCLDWYTTNKDNIQLHLSTREWVEFCIDDFMFNLNDPPYNRRPVHRARMCDIIKGI